MTLRSRLPEEAKDVAYEQGWNDGVLGLMLLNFIEDNVQDHAVSLTYYLRKVAKLENGISGAGEVS